MRYLLLFLFACGTATGKVQVVVTPEDTITEGLSPGEEEENIRDGWTVEYDKFLITLGDFNGYSNTDRISAGDGRSFVIDLKGTAGTGVEVTTFPAKADLRYDAFGYSMLTANKDSMPVGGISTSDYMMMVTNGYSLYVKGSMSKEGRTVTFTWPFKGATRYDNCAASGVQPGFAVGAQQTTTVEPTIHGDHWFFTNAPHVSTPKRLADWISLCDDNDDGDVTFDEMKAHTAAQLFVSGDYNLSSLTFGPILDGFDYWSAQARSLGHFQGDGECGLVTLLAADPRERQK